AATLALGHIERQRGRIDTAWQHYFLALRLFEKEHDARGQANASLALGHIERQRGRYARAAEYYGKARSLAHDAHDRVAEADAARGEGEMLTANSSYSPAESALQRALTLYQQTRDQFGEVDTLNSLGRLQMDSGAIEAAATSYGQAIAQASPVEYELGEADGALGLAEIAIKTGRLDQALASAMKAGSTYGENSSALGGAEVNRVLGEINMRRGQLLQANTSFERAMRAFRTLRAQVPYTRAMLGAAESNRRRGSTSKAEDFFTEAQTLAGEVTQPMLEGEALLGLGRIARVRGRTEIAEPLLTQARKRFDAHKDHSQLAHISLEQARLALTGGRLDEATHLTQQTIRQARKASASTGERSPEAMANALWASISMTLGQTGQARAHAHEASHLAEEEADEQAQVEACLVAAEVELLSENLQSAVNAYHHAQTVAQAHEATVADASASVGLGRIMLRRELWEEAATTLNEALPRLRAAEDVAAQALALVSLGEARRNLDDATGALAACEQAARLAHESGNPLLEAEALAGEARALLVDPELEAAVGRYQQALALVERVGQSVADLGDRAAFFDGYAALYAEAVFAAARERSQAISLEVATSFATRATRPGRHTAAQRVREFARSIQTSGRDLEPEELERNKQVVALLDAARKALAR
ncbi:MAG TPA: tetratricopeptide repeat protein, partial [Ktedonobacterales bacterium]|nr:tetratricopeptide repeat protein [Ktedonobacterales bacterium]